VTNIYKRAGVEVRIRFKLLSIQISSFNVTLNGQVHNWVQRYAFVIRSKKSSSFRKKADFAIERVALVRRVPEAKSSNLCYQANPTKLSEKFLSLSKLMQEYQRKLG
jgi:hypothetical protein